MSSEEYQILMVGRDTITILKIVDGKPVATYEVPQHKLERQTND